MRILILAHGHPETIAGGAERAAYSLFRALRADKRVSFCAFAAAASPDLIGHAAAIGSFRGRPDELLVTLPPLDPFTLESRDVDELEKRIGDLVRFLRPDVVHMHHVLNWGIEAIEILTRAGVRSVVTLHEFILICHHNGQMIRPSGELCHESSPVDCNRCFPDIAAGKFFIRSAILRRVLENVDALVAPSRFLAGRFEQWSRSHRPVAVIDNILGQTMENGAAEKSGGSGAGRAPHRRGSKIVFGYFGQINPYKGVPVLLEAFTLLPDKVRDRIELRIHGENRHWTGGAFQERLDKLYEAVDGQVRRYGAYRNEDVVGLMRDCDWIVVPSIWWENSPVVIQEARLAGCRLICSDIGGMAEKTDPGVDLRFTAGNAGALAALIEDIVESGTQDAEDEAKLNRAANLKKAQQAALAAHVELYRDIFSKKVLLAKPERQSELRKRRS